MNDENILAKLTDCEYFKQYHTVAPPKKEQYIYLLRLEIFLKAGT